MYLLDTDHLSFLDRGGKEGQQIRQRILIVGVEKIAVSAVSYEEQLRGWLAYMGASSSIDAQVVAYERLLKHLKNYCALTVLPFDSAVADVFQNHWLQRPRIGTMDLKIAATAIATNRTLLTANSKDFSRVPDLNFEDWTQSKT